MKRRVLFAGVASVLAGWRHGSAPPPVSGPLTAVITQGSNTYTYLEAGGSGSTATAAGTNYPDQFGARFVQSMTTITRSDFPLRIKVYRIVGDSTGWWRLVAEWGDIQVNNAASLSPSNPILSLPLAPYSCTVNGLSIAGNFASGHPCFARWTTTSDRHGGAMWPFAYRTVAAMYAANELPQFDWNMIPGARENPFNSSDWYRLNYAGPLSYGTMFLQQNGYGERPEIGLIPEWCARWICSSQGATQSVFQENIDVGEAGWSYPYYYWDSATGKVIDAITTYPTALNNQGSHGIYDPSNTYFHQGPPVICSSPSASSMKVRFAGTPGATFPSGTFVCDQHGVAGNNVYSVPALIGNPVYTIPGGGTLDVVCLNSGPNVGTIPDGTALFICDSGGSAVTPPTGISGVTSQSYGIYCGIGTQITTDSSHQGNFFLMAFLLTGDCYFLEGIHAAVMYMASEDNRFGPGGVVYPSFGTGEPRANAWCTRDLMLAAHFADGGASWLLPNTLFQTALDGWRTSITNDYNSSSPVNHSGLQMLVRGATGPYGPACSGGSPSNQTWNTIWQFYYLAQVLPWTSMLHPEWATLAAISQLICTNMLNAASGWCPALCGPYTTIMGPGNCVYDSSWATVLAANLGQTVNGPTYPSSCPVHIPGSGLDGGATGYLDYQHTLMSAMGIAKQAGLTVYQAGLDYVVTEVTYAAATQQTDSIPCKKRMKIT